MWWCIKNFINEKIEIKSVRFISNKSLGFQFLKPYTLSSEAHYHTVVHLVKIKLFNKLLFFQFSSTETIYCWVG